MASGKTKGKSKVKPKLKTSRPRSSDRAQGASFQRRRADPRLERRFLPRSAAGGLLSLLLSSAGALAIGAGVFGRFLRAAGPHPYALHLLVGGSVLFFVGLALGSRAALVVRVGDAGVALERGEGAIERLGWFEVESVRFAQNTLAFSGSGKIVSISASENPDAAGVALAEARARIPNRVAGIKESLPEPPSSAGESLQLEPPQLAGLRCRASNRLISFEADAVLCGRCGESYHQEGVPEHCVTCDAGLA